ncbi:MAG: hypothetical protein NT049_17235, partial [Planctomycetota bacterium]|nr:hypothetical protein [Planctomycetota bacterium]
MPKPMRTHPRGAAGAATLCSLGLLVACCGCPGMLWKPELPKAVNIVIQADGSITVDGTPETSSMDMLELIKQKVEVRQKALQAVPPPAVPLPPAQQPREVLITFASPENSTYRDLFRALLACGIARLVDLEGIPMSFPNEAPSTDGPNPPNPPWLPLDIAGPADLPKLQAHAADLNGRAVMLRAGVDTPLTLVLDILRTIHASGGTFGFIFFDDAIAKSGKTHVIIETGVLCPNGGVNMSPKTTAEMRARFEARRKKSNAVPTTGPVSPNFFGVPIGKPPRKIVFILDRSGSMTDSIDFVKHELKRCVGCLADSDRFHIIFFSSGPPVEMPPRQLVA